MTTKSDATAFPHDELAQAGYRAADRRAGVRRPSDHAPLLVEWTG